MGKVRTNWKLSAYLLLVVLQLLLSGCDRSPPEEAIRAALAELEEAIERGDTGAVMDRLSEEVVIQYHGTELQQVQIQRTLMGLFLRYPQRQLTLTQIDIELDPLTGEQARVRFTALTWGGRGALPDNADGHQVDSHWHYDGQWLIDSMTAR